MSDLAPYLDKPTAIVGTTGAGKTFAAKGAVEQLLRLGRRVIIIDPTGAWWGLRAGADGNQAGGFPVVIFGGDHADVPVTPDAEAGKALALALAERDVQAIIDISEMTGREKNRFLTPFLENLYARNKAALHLVVDEADEVAAQRLADGEQRLFGAFDKIVRRGRLKGFRPLMISQRPAVIHKNVLSQIGTLIALKLTSPQDRKAIKEWVKGNADADQAKAVMQSLPTLARGEGWVWSPADGVLERTTFPAIQTFDSSRTPDHEEAVVAPALTAVDVAGLRAAMSASSASNEVAKADTSPGCANIDRAKQEDYHSGWLAGLEEGERRGKAAGMALGIARAQAALNGLRADEIGDTSPAPAPASSNGRTPAFDAVNRGSSPRAGTSSAQKIVDVVLSVYPRGISLQAAAKQAGLSPRSSAFRSHLAQAKASTAITVRADGRYVATEPPHGVSVPEGLLAFKARLPGSYSRMLEVIEKAAGRPLSRDEIAELADVSRTSSGLGAGLRELRELELIVEQSGGFALHPDLAEERADG